MSTRALAPCGSLSAYRRHKRLKEPVDKACAEAAREQTRKRRAKPLAAVTALPEVSTISGIDELEDARENLRILSAAMREAPASAIAGISKQRQALVARIAVLTRASAPRVGVVDELARLREERRAKA